MLRGWLTCVTYRSQCGGTSVWDVGMWRKENTIGSSPKRDGVCDVEERHCVSYTKSQYFLRKTMFL